MYQVLYDTYSINHNVNDIFLGTAYLVQSDQFSERLFPHMHEASHSPCRQNAIDVKIIMKF